MFRILKFLERFERQNSSVFWLVISFSSLVVSSSFTTQSQSSIQFSTSTEVSVPSSNWIKPGGKQEVPKDSFVPPGSTNLPNRGNDQLINYDPKPKYPWGADPNFNGYDGGSMNRASPNFNDYFVDPNQWDREQEELMEDEDPSQFKLGTPVDFEYQYDESGNPTLLVPNYGYRLQNNLEDKIKSYTSIEFDQTASHLHHIPDFNIKLPDNFDMTFYETLNRADRIAYAKKTLSPETIISYQNAIGRAMIPIFVRAPNKPGVPNKKKIDICQIPALAGKRKVPSDIIIAPITDEPDSFMFSLIKRDVKNTHITSYKIDSNQLNKMREDGFWVLKKSDINI